MRFVKYLGQIDAYADILQKYFGRVSSIMVWIGFITYYSTIFGLLPMILIAIGLILLIFLLVWFDVKFILPNKQNYYANKNPFLRSIKDDINKK